jgi:putative hemolysin
VTASRRVGLLPVMQEDLIHRALDLESITVREIMVPRPNIFSLPADMELQEALTNVVQEQHSRVPVYDPKRGPEHIIGLLYSKDLTRWMRLRLVLGVDTSGANRLAKMEVRQIMRDVLVVPETKPLGDLLVEFKKRKRHLAVVVDEFGSTAGVVTVEDVLEQLVGEIEDEFDVAPQPLTPGTTEMVLEGSTPIRDLENQYHVVLPREEGFETLAGFVLAQLQRLPQVGDTFEFENRRFTVQEMEGHRVAKVKIEMLDEPQPEPAAQREAS